MTGEAIEHEEDHRGETDDETDQEIVDVESVYIIDDDYEEQELDCSCGLMDHDSECNTEHGFGHQAEHDFAAKISEMAQHGYLGRSTVYAVPSSPTPTCKFFQRRIYVFSQATQTLQRKVLTTQLCLVQLKSNLESSTARNPSSQIVSIGLACSCAHARKRHPDTDRDGDSVSGVSREESTGVPTLGWGQKTSARR